MLVKHLIKNLNIILNKHYEFGLLKNWMWNFYTRKKLIKTLVA